MVTEPALVAPGGDHPVGLVHAVITATEAKTRALALAVHTAARSGLAVHP